MEYAAFERWVQSNEKEFDKDILRYKIQNITLLGLFVIVAWLLYLQYKNVQLPLWASIIILLTMFIVFPTILTLTNKKLKFGQFISILLMKIANEIQIYQPKEKNKLFNYLKLLNKNFKPKELKKLEDFTPYEKHLEIKQKFENNMFSLSKQLYHAMKEDKLNNFHLINEIKMLANHIFNQDGNMYSQAEKIIKIYPYWYEFPKKYDFIKKFSLPKNQWLRLFILEIILIGFLYLVYLKLKLDINTLFTGFIALTVVIISIIFKK